MAISGRFDSLPDLERVLAKLGSSLSATEVRELVAGIAAAPPDSDPLAWLRLFGPDLGCGAPEVIEILRQLLASVVVAEPGGPADRAPRLAALRAELGRRRLAGFIVPRADEHQGEYVPLRAQRLAWLTGFTGSAGLAVVLADRAAIFVDGRYTLQVRSETDANHYEFRHLVDEPYTTWLTGAVPVGGRVGYDPWLHTADWVEKARNATARAGIDLIACADNPIDAIWPDQPSPPLAPVVPHELRYAGRASDEKRREIGAGLARNGVGAVVLGQPDSIAWLLNIRGGDVANSPLALSFAILDAGGEVDLFIDRRKLIPATIEHLGAQVRVHPGEALGPILDQLGGGGRKVQVDPSSSASWLFDRLHLAGARVVHDVDPCTLPKACKNTVELAGMRSAHRRDGVAMVRFLHWLDENAGTGQVSEAEAARRLLDFRRAGELFRGLSFETISAAGPNAAIVHYRVSAGSDRRLSPGDLYLVDSGAQYYDGTTDITRTVAIGTPSSEMCECFTLVLKGHIALATARFPPGTTGTQIDAFARRALWAAGLDYDHGTGHGVGSYLGVHEGPQRISKMTSSVALHSGMILSNEPGYYKTDAYGIRIENLVAVQTEASGTERSMLGFETLTLAPIDRRLIAIEALEGGERAWLDAYHEGVRAALVPLLDEPTASWLIAATRPLGRC